jgi:hypothetical protein
MGTEIKPTYSFDPKEHSRQLITYHLVVKLSDRRSVCSETWELELWIAKKCILQGLESFVLNCYFCATANEDLNPVPQLWVPDSAPVL